MFVLATFGFATIPRRWRHGVEFPSCGWVTSSTGAFLPDVRRGSAECPGGTENQKAVLHRASGAPEAAVTCQECPSQSAEGRGDALYRHSIEKYPGGGQSGPSHRSEPLLWKLGKCCVWAVWHEVLDSTLLFLRISKCSSLKASFPFPFLFCSSCHYLSVRSRSWTRKKTPPNPENYVTGRVQCMDWG